MNQTQNQKPLKRLIKEAIRDRLLGKTDAKANVFISKSTPTSEEEFPAILIYSLNENATRFTQSPKDYKRVLSVIVECLANGDDDEKLDLSLETMAERVEALIEADETLGDLVDRLELDNVVYGLSEEGSSYMGSVFVAFNVTYYTDAIRPDAVCYEPLIDADVTIQSGPRQEYESKDIYNFEQGENNG